MPFATSGARRFSSANQAKPLLRHSIFLSLFLALLASAGWAICSLPPPEEDPPRDVPRESPPGDDTDPPETPPERGPRTPRKPSAGTRPQSGSRRGANYGASWRIWWELNREHMLGLRGTIESKEVVSGGVAPAPRDDESRAKVQAR